MEVAGKRKPSTEVTQQRIAIIYDLLARTEGATTAELIAATGITKQAISLWRREFGAVKRDGSWHLPQEAQEGE